MKTNKETYYPSDAEMFDDAEKGNHPYFNNFEWFAVDREGLIAYFDTAGFGAVPQSFFGETSDYLSLKNYLEDLAFVSEFDVHDGISHGDQHYVNYARRGVYVYDWASGLGWYEKEPYSLLISPRNPATITDLDEVHQKILEKVHFAEISFRDSEKIIVEDFFEVNV